MVYPINWFVSIGTQVSQKLISFKVVAILLLVVFGQMTASAAIACEMMTMEQFQTTDHSAHDMSNHQDHSNSSTDNCCEQSGNCSMSGCLVLAMSTELDSSAITISTESIDTALSQVPRLTSNSLYRPPILS
jgi:hypothetical protein